MSFFPGLMRKSFVYYKYCMQQNIRAVQAITSKSQYNKSEVKINTNSPLIYFLIIKGQDVAQNPFQGFCEAESIYLKIVCFWLI